MILCLGLSEQVKSFAESFGAWWHEELFQRWLTFYISDMTLDMLWQYAEAPRQFRHPQGSLVWHSNIPPMPGSEKRRKQYINANCQLFSSNFLWKVETQLEWLTLTFSEKLLFRLCWFAVFVNQGTNPQEVTRRNLLWAGQNLFCHKIVTIDSRLPIFLVHCENLLALT